jgi:glycerol-3-phosphate acyltransferase PlsY
MSLTLLAAAGRFVLAALVAYLCGSIPSGVLIGKLVGNIDPRTRGSGKTGATNILRTLGPGAAAVVGLIDVAKGVAAVLLARYLVFPGQPWAETVAGFAALLGHNYSVFIRFTGGRGVATGGGVALAMQPLAVLAGVVGLVIPIAITRYVSLGSIIATATCAVADAVLVALGRDNYAHLVFLAVGAAFIIYSHRDNITRLMSGTERKLGDRGP